jgi:hypothetical protein
MMGGKFPDGNIKNLKIRAKIQEHRNLCSGFQGFGVTSEH